MGEKLPFIQPAAPPPDAEEGDVLKAQIVDIQKVVSKWKDDEGNPKQQLQFNFRLPDGFSARAWMGYYDQPNDRSKLGKLLLTLYKKTGVVYKSVDEALEALKQYGVILVKVNGYREWQGAMYPKFGVVVDRIPKKELGTLTSKKEPVPTPKVASTKQGLNQVILESMEPDQLYQSEDLFMVAPADVTKRQVDDAIKELIGIGSIEPVWTSGWRLQGFRKGKK